MISKYNIILASSDTRLDKRDKAILQYIKEHEGPNENQIVNALHKQKLSSKRTTLKKIKELKEKGEIIDSLKEGQSGFHRLYINEDKSEFNQISEKLSEVEVLLDPFEKYAKLIDQRHARFGLDKAKDEIYFLFIAGYFESLTLMLVMLLDWTKNVIRSEKDAQILYEKIIQLFTKLFKISPIKTLKNMLEETMLSSMKKEESTIQEIESKIAKYEKKTPIPKSKIRDQIQLMGNEIKSTESHIDIIKLQQQLSKNLLKKLKDFDSFK